MLKAARNSGGVPTIQLTISSTQTAVYNAFTQAGSPAGVVALLIIVNSSVVLQAGLTITGFAAGSRATILNNGRIAGLPGNGAGSNYIAAFDPVAFNTYLAGNGGNTTVNAGHAVNTTIPLTIDNTSGEIFGGGGGGGGGVDSYGVAGLTAGQNYTYGLAATGGGGGQGYSDSNWGQPGNSGQGYPSPNYPPTTYPAAGTSAGPGSGGQGAFVVAPFEAAGDGGSGGAWGAVGLSGTTGTRSTGSVITAGSGGNAVKHTGTTCTFTAGNNSTQVKGAVSV